VAQAVNPDLALFGALRKMMRDNIKEARRSKGDASSSRHRIYFTNYSSEAIFHLKT
jgi:hypothetical protein